MALLLEENGQPKSRRALKMLDDEPNDEKNSIGRKRRTVF